ncbi:hypothetical protein LZ32DRAFT_191224 [Colletotrichum eremochloae]|nr:hypothetical protein LZ32DRAFT_191224 [Colletotrichum eremochloae]
MTPLSLCVLPASHRLPVRGNRCTTALFELSLPTTPRQKSSAVPAGARYSPSLLPSGVSPTRRAHTHTHTSNPIKCEPTHGPLAARFQPKPRCRACDSQDSVTRTKSLISPHDPSRPNRYPCLACGICKKKKRKKKRKVASTYGVHYLQTPKERGRGWTSGHARVPASLFPYMALASLATNRRDRDGICRRLRDACV